MAGSGSASSSWAPLRIGLFRTLWIAVLVSNVGTWMQTVGAQWLVVHDAHAAILVSLRRDRFTHFPLSCSRWWPACWQISSTGPGCSIAVLACMTATGAALTALTAAHQMHQALLLTFTFALGTGAILIAPAYQSLVPDMVPRAGCKTGEHQFDQRQPGSGHRPGHRRAARRPDRGVGGVRPERCHVPPLRDRGGVPPPARRDSAVSRAVPSWAAQAGGRYVRHAPVVRRILLRAALFLVPGSALWALLPLIATRRLGLGAGRYGVLLGALGVGAVGGAVVLPQIRARLSANALVAVASLTYAAVLVAVALSRSIALTVLMLLRPVWPG